MDGVNSGVCGTCKHWRGNMSDESAVCGRYPPSAGGVVMVQGIAGPQPLTLWGNPNTPRNHFCGEFKPAVMEMGG